MLKNTLFLFLFSVISFFGNAQSIRFYDVQDFNDYQLILRKAIDEKKMLFAAVYDGEDETFGNMVRNDIFKNDSLLKSYENFLAFAINIESEMGARLAQSFDINAIPTFLYLTNEEELIFKISGNLSTEDFLKNGKKAKENNQLYQNLKEKYSTQKLTNSEWPKLIELYGLNHSFSETQELAYEYLNSLNSTEIFNEQNRDILSRYGIDMETDYPSLILKNKTKLDSAEFAAFYESAFAYNFDRAAANGDTLLLEKILTKLLPQNPDTAIDSEDLKFQTRKIFAVESEVFSVWEMAVLEKSKTLKNDSARAEFLFDEAYQIADEYNSEKAQKVVRQLAKISNELNPDFRYKMLEAYMAYLMKDYPDAKSLISMAKTMTQNPNNLRKAEGLERMVESEK